MDILNLVGEREEFGDRTQVPDSYYIIRTSVGSIDVYDSGTPYVELGATILEGPFKDEELSIRYSLSFGREESSGGIIPLKFGACAALSGQPADTAVFESFGFGAPEATGDVKEDAKAMRNALKDFVCGLDASTRLDVITKALRVAQWDGKTVVAHISLREKEVLNPETGQYESTGAGPFFNDYEGFYKMSHSKKGAEYVRKVCHPKQERELAGV